MRSILLLLLLFNFLTVNAQSFLCTPNDNGLDRACAQNCDLCVSNTETRTRYESASVSVSVPAGQFLQVGNTQCGDSSGSLLDGGDEVKINDVVQPSLRNTFVCFENNGATSISVSITLTADRSDECISYEVLSTSPGVCSLLPIELGFFKARLEDDFVNVIWQTTLELNNDYMEVQRSRNGKDFATIGKVAGAGTTDEPQDYTFIDKSPLPGVSYYRLRQVDFDGAFEIHQTAIVERKLSNWEIQILPTIANNRLTVVSSEQLQEETVYTIHNFNGQQVQSGKVSTATGTLEVDVSQLVGGMYRLQLQSATEVTFSTFIKQ